MVFVLSTTSHGLSVAVGLLHLPMRTNLMKRHRIIAPRLADGSRRIPFGHGLPEEVKDGLRKIARLENKSMSWVLEQVIIRYFRMDTPAYVNKPNLKLVKSNGRAR